MEYRCVIEGVFEHLENDDLGKAVMACLRLARHTQDYLNTAVFREFSAIMQSGPTLGFWRLSALTAHSSPSWHER